MRFLGGKDTQKTRTGKKTKKEGTKIYKQYYTDMLSHLQIGFVKVEGHSGDRYNDRADALAREAIGKD